MRIDKYISIEQEVEINLSPEDIQMIFSENDSLPHILQGLNSVAGFLKGISDDRINEMPESTKLLIYKFLAKESVRYNKPLYFNGKKPS